MDRSGPNLLFICSDQHNRSMCGCYGNPYVITPAIDSIAAGGTRFENAYSPNPICVPARASLATGCLSHQLRCWDNASPYVGPEQALSFGHQLERAGVPVTTIGKLHFRSAVDDTGFYDQRLPLHVRDGVGDLFGTIRERGVTKPIMRGQIPAAHPGESSYSKYDRDITRLALEYLDSKTQSAGPWCLYVGYTFPHLPFTCPQEAWDMYDEAHLPPPFASSQELWPQHPSLKDIREFFGLQEPFKDSEVMGAVHAYYGMCSFLDAQVRQLLEKLRETGLSRNTYIIYTSDHGEMMGNLGLWFKNCLLEDSVAVPLIVSGPDIPQGVNRTNVSLTDIYPTILHMFNVQPVQDGNARSGVSLLELSQKRQDMERTVFSEFHASASYTGGFMVRQGNIKYIRYLGYKPQLFDLSWDPHELHDLAGRPEYSGLLEKMEERLRQFCDPEAVESECRKDQAARLSSYGGKEHILTDFEPIIFSPPPNG